MNRSQRKTGKTRLHANLMQQDNAWWNKALAHHQRKELTQAAACYARVSPSSPHYQAVLNNQALIAMQQKHYEHAVTLLRHALSIQPDFVDALINLGIVLKEQGQLEEAEACYRHIVTLQPDDVRAYGNLGVILKNRGQFADALTCYQQILTRHPHHVETLNNLGTLQKELGHLEMAAIHYRKALLIRPDQVDIMINLGIVCRELGRMEEAQTLFGQAATLRPNHPETLLNLGLTCKQLGHLQEAEHYYRKALIIQPQTARAYDLLGNVLHEQGRLQEAEASYRHALANQPDCALTHKHLGDTLRKLQQPEEAAACYRQALAIDPQDRASARFALAAMGCEPLPARASDDMLLDIYSKRARHWDQHNQTTYRGAEWVAQALRAQSLQQGGLAVLDAGCGTGMVGEWVRDWVTLLDGVDLSAEMLEKAREKQIYDNLYCQDLLSFMTGHPEAYDAITSAATLIHFGDLSPVFMAASQTLRKGGCFVFTLFPNEADLEGESVVVNPLDGFERGGCYVHGRGHVVAAATSAGFVVERMQLEIHEYLHDLPVHCFVVVAIKQSNRPSPPA
ncbi:MAG: tetratricopeptide repeat protein [Magnetococcus sp. YQC-5]